MNILFIDFESQFTGVAKTFIDAGHSVWNTAPVTEYEKSLGIQNLGTKSWSQTDYQHLLDAITANSIDTIINGMPHTAWLRSVVSPNVTYLGPTEEAAGMELNRFITKNAVSSAAGINVSPTLYEGTTDNIAEGLTTIVERPVIFKPKSARHSAIIIKEGDDKTIIDRLTSKAPFDYYLERFIPNMVMEAMACFTIGNGQWAIEHTQLMKGDEGKSARSKAMWARDTTYQKLPANAQASFDAFASTWLAWAASKGGNYQGVLYGGIDSSNKVWYIECSARPTAPAVIPVLATAEQYLEGLKSDPNVLADNSLWENWKSTTISAVDHLTKYPIHLHEQWGVKTPSNIIKEGYYYSLGRSQGTILYHDGDLPSEFLDSLTSEGNFKIVTLE